MITAELAEFQMVPELGIYMHRPLPRAKYHIR